VAEDLLRERPAQVKKIVYAGSVILILESIIFLFSQGYLRYQNLAFFLISTGLLVFLIGGVWNGKNWVRRVWIVISIMGIPAALVGILTQQMSEVAKFIYSIQFALGLIVLYYLTKKETVGWFKRIKLMSYAQTRTNQQESRTNKTRPKFGNQEEYEKWKVEKLGATTDRQQNELVSENDPQRVLREIWKSPLLGMEFVFVSGGWFEMEDTSVGGRDGESSVYRVYVDGFWMGKFVVTQGQWEKLMNQNPSVYKKGRDYPVEHVNWIDVQEFIRRLNQKTEMGFRLPTDEEWEYAARSGGKSERWAGTDNESELSDYAWYIVNSGGETHPVGQKNPNGLGLYDMSGNVREWVQKDCGVLEQEKVVRGGSWSDRPSHLMTSFRTPLAPDGGINFVGFRLVLTAK
jgi:formylglycine-generating enzyme required for sulfatase activity